MTNPRLPDKLELKELLDSVVQFITNELEYALANNTISLSYQEYFYIKPKDYEHSATGIRPKTTYTYEKSKIRFDNVISHIQAKLKEYNHYQLLEKYTELPCLMPYFIRRVITTLSENGSQQEITTSCIDPLINNLLGEKNVFGAKVSLNGLNLEPRSVKLDSSITIRQPVKKDYEYYLPKEPFPSHRQLFRYPSSYLQIQMRLRPNNNLDMNPQQEIYSRIDIAIAVLRLFHVGAVEFTQIKSYTDSFLSISGGTATKTRLMEGNAYTIRKNDVVHLKYFWKSLQQKDVQHHLNLDHTSHPNYLGIAYNRYCDSLENTIIEKRISSAVMGLEALYLLSEEKSESSYKLRMRCSRLVSLAGHQAVNVKEKIRDAYDIRSTFVHGGLMTKKDKTKYERRYGDINSFSIDILELLRLSIVLLIDKPNKDSLVHTIDDSFLDSSRIEALQNLIFRI